MAYTTITLGSPVSSDVMGDNLDEADSLLSSLQRRSKQHFRTSANGVIQLDQDFPTDQVDPLVYNALFNYGELEQILPVGKLLLESHLIIGADPHGIVGTLGIWSNSAPSGGFVYPCDGSSSLFADGSFDSVEYAAVNPSDPEVSAIAELPLTILPTDGTSVELIYRTRINDWGGSGGATGQLAGVLFYNWLRVTSSSVGNLTLNIQPQSYWTIAQLV